MFAGLQFDFRSCHLEALWSWARLLTSQCLSFFPCQMEVEVVLASWNCWRYGTHRAWNAKLLISYVLVIHFIIFLGSTSGTQAGRTGSCFWNTGSLSAQGLKGNVLVSKSIIIYILLVRDRLVPGQWVQRGRKRTLVARIEEPWRRSDAGHSSCCPTNSAGKPASTPVWGNPMRGSRLHKQTSGGGSVQPKS